MAAPSVHRISSSTSNSASPPSAGGFLSQSEANSVTGGENSVTDLPRCSPCSISSLPVRPGLLRKQYDSALFQSLVGVFSRLFCDDEQIVVVDFLSREEHSYTEKELVERLGWQEKRLREVCSKLAKEQILIKEQITPFHTHGGVAPNSNSPSSSDVLAPKEKFYTQTFALRDKALPVSGNAPYYYRINSHIIPLLQWRSQKVLQILDSALHDGKIHDCYKCPDCGKEYDSLQAQCLKLHSEDAHFLCRCGSRLEHEDNREELSKITHLQRCCQEQLAILHKFIERSWGMEIPIFSPYSKSKKATENSINVKKRGVLSAVGSCLSAGSSTHSDGDGVQRTPHINSGDLISRSTVSITGSNSLFKLEMHQIDAASVPKKAIPLWLQKSGQRVDPPAFSKPLSHSFYPTATVNSSPFTSSITTPSSSYPVTVSSTVASDELATRTASSPHVGICSSTTEGIVSKNNIIPSPSSLTTSNKSTETRSQVRFSVKAGKKLVTSSQNAVKSSKSIGVSVDKSVQGQPQLASLTVITETPLSTFLKPSSMDPNPTMATSIEAPRKESLISKKRLKEEVHAPGKLTQSFPKAKKERRHNHYTLFSALNEPTEVSSTMKIDNFAENQSKESAGASVYATSVGELATAEFEEPKIFVSKFNKSFTLNGLFVKFVLLK